MVEEIIIKAKTSTKLNTIQGLFKIVKFDLKYVALSFEGDKIDFLNIEDISLANINDFFESNKENFAEIISKNKQNVDIIIKSVPDIIEVPEYNIFMSKTKSYDMYIRNVHGTSKKCVFLCTNIEEVDKSGQKMEIIKQHNLVDFNESKKHIVIKKETSKESVDYFTTTFKTSSIRNVSNYKYSLFFGDINFTKEIEPINKIFELRTDLHDGSMNKYLNLWNMYNNLEKEKSYLLAKEIGTFKVIRSHVVRDKYLRIEFKKIDFETIFQKNILKNSLILTDVNLDDYQQINSIDDYINLEKKSNPQKLSYDASQESVSKENCTIDFKFDGKQLENGRLMISLIGDKSMYERRELAKKRILTKQTGIPHLIDYFVFDEQIENKTQEFKEIKIPASLSNLRKIDFEFNEKLLNESNLTHTQKQAVKIICTTPNIAIIQGPPGTGKTTVINHAIEQLASANLLDLSNEIDTLLTAFRHETVTNVKNKVRVCGIPSVQITNNHTNNDDEEELKLEEDLLEYIDDINSKLEKDYKHIKFEFDELDSLSEIIMNFDLYYNTCNELINLTEQIKSFNYLKYKSNLKSKLDEVQKEIILLSNKESNSNILNIAYNIPYTKTTINDLSITYLDDLEFASQLFKEPLLLDVITILVKKPIDLKELYDLRVKLILKYKPKQSILVDSNVKSKVKNILNYISKDLEIDRYESYNGVERAIYDFMSMMKENPIYIKNTIAKYVRVLAATNQQVASKKVSQFKNDKVTQMYKNVFIDEAATSPPLDLFIPMVLAKQRIVLVGDHKQLPNIVNDDHLKDMSSEEVSTEELTEMIGVTLFERLFHKLSVMEASSDCESIQRVITLDQQFRTHPQLGHLVSKHFYDDKVKSPRPEEDFNHNYGGLTNEFALWIDVKYNQNPKFPYRMNNSRQNYDEAEAIATHIKKALEHTTDKISIGVITMFTPQKQLVEDQLIAKGILSETNRVSEKYQDILSLEYNTVDATQGKEYDIVYLSLVLAIDPKNKNKNYSRLTRHDLLCVALSRQKKLLITVGDKSLFNGDINEEYGVLCELAQMSKELKV